MTAKKLSLRLFDASSGQTAVCCSPVVSVRFLLLLLCFLWVDSAHAKFQITKVWIALGTAQKIPSNREVRARLGTSVRGYLVIEGKIGKRSVVFTEARRLKKGRRLLRGLRRWPRRWKQPSITWFKLESDPKGGIYDNTGTMEFTWHPERKGVHPEKWHWCPIDYVLTKTAAEGKWVHQVNARPHRTPDRYGGLGTMRFVARVNWNGQQVTSIGIEHRNKTGLKIGHPTVRFRRDNSEVGYMTELMNVPYVFGSSGSSARTHQTERAVGADCADLVVYGWRRKGKRIPYTWSQGLKKYTRRKAQVEQFRMGRYLRGSGQPIRFGSDIKKGDILLWSRHVAVVTDIDPSGVLTPNTMVLHTIMGSPELVKLNDIGFGFDSPPFEVRRPKWRR